MKIVIIARSFEVETCAAGFALCENGMEIPFKFYEAGDGTVSQLNIGVTTITCVDGEFFDASEDLIDLFKQVSRKVFAA